MYVVVLPPPTAVWSSWAGEIPAAICPQEQELHLPSCSLTCQIEKSVLHPNSLVRYTLGLNFVDDAWDTPFWNNEMGTYTHKLESKSKQHGVDDIDPRTMLASGYIRNGPVGTRIVQHVRSGKTYFMGRSAGAMMGGTVGCCVRGEVLQLHGTECELCSLCELCVCAGQSYGAECGLCGL